jgi:hypothetical protein
MEALPIFETPLPSKPFREPQTQSKPEAVDRRACANLERSSWSYRNCLRSRKDNSSWTAVRPCQNLC